MSVDRAVVASASGQVVRMQDVRRRVKLSESHLYFLISEGKFPRPFSLVPGGRSKGWLESTIDAYLADRQAAYQAGDEK